MRDDAAAAGPGAAGFVAVVLAAWILALAVVAAPTAGLPALGPGPPGSVDRFGLVACLALAAASAPRARPRVRGGARTPAPAVAALGAVALFLPLAALAGVLDAQAGRPRSPAPSALVLAFAYALAWSAERARGERGSAARYAGAWALLLGLPAVAATLFAGFGSLDWSPLVWSLAPRDPSRALAPCAVVALVLGLAAVRPHTREV